MTAIESTPAIESAPAAAKPELEKETCTRCCGSGHYSYCQMYGTTCFRCQGSGKTYTKRGAAAKAYLETIRSKPASEIKPGDRIIWRMCGKKMLCTVQAVEPASTLSRSFINGIEQPRRADLIDIETTAVSLRSVAPESVVRMVQDDASAKATFAMALAYQETLTKTGKPRVRGRSAK